MQKKETEKLGKENLNFESLNVLFLWKSSFAKASNRCFIEERKETSTVFMINVIYNGLFLRLFYFFKDYFWM